eukprot:TRINITY_DN25107_c0_g1_i5.p1 TRINITY_DN25107_c0_g1~~TRINITY_DN25107_c0_g1_i5.p1  ORF type:complete len:121 (+),score=9.18 TRINITY_DN25107_c0_g1_i5:75-437(+)
MVVIQKQKNQSDLRPDVKSFQSVHFEDCEDCGVVLSEISTLLLINCTNVRVTFSTATSCELRKCSSCKVTANACGTYKLEESTGTKISFVAKSADSLQWAKIGRAVQQECRDRSRMPSSA